MFRLHDVVLRDAGFRPVAPDAGTQDSPLERHEEYRVLVCRTCGLTVTSLGHGIAVNGKQIHALFNPAGILFEVGCFSLAAGCRFEGVFTTEFTWFPGYGWRYAFCRQCGVHLGWEYRSEVDGFVGLIMSELRES